MQAKLKQTNQKWYDSLLEYDLSWEEWKAKLRATFPNCKDDDTRAEGEDYSEYFFSKVALLEPCQVAPKQAVSFIIDGLNDRMLQISTRAGQYQTTEDLYMQFLSLLPPMEKRRKGDVKTATENTKGSKKKEMTIRVRSKMKI